MCKSIDMKTPQRCLKCKEHYCETTWIIVEDNISTEVVTRDCEPNTYKRLPKWINTDEELELDKSLS
jgi:hypothetical protein